MLVIGNTATPEPTKALNTATPNPTGTPLPTNTRTNTPTSTATLASTVRPTEAQTATPNWEATVRAFERQLDFGALYNTVQMIEFIERQCNLGCYEKAVIVKSQPQVEGSNVISFNVGSKLIFFNINSINPNLIYTSERNLTYVTDQPLLTGINEILIKYLDQNKGSKNKNYAETRLIDIIQGNREKGISPFNNFKILLEKYDDGTYGLIAYLEVDVCAVVPAPTNTATATPTLVWSTPTAIPTIPPERPTEPARTSTPNPTVKTKPPVPPTVVLP